MYDDDLIKKLRQKGQTWEQIGNVFDTASDNVRKYASSKDWFYKIREDHKITDAVKDTIDKKTTDRQTGFVTSQIKRKMSEVQTFTDDELLELHALDSSVFQIRTITSNEWSVTNGDGEQYFNFQSKIVAEPKKVKELTVEDIASAFKDIQPKKVPLLLDEVPDSYLLIPLYDMHFGLNTYEDYLTYLQKITDVVLNGYAEILVIVGGDYMHVETNTMQTEYGTRVDDVFVEKMKQDGARFLLDLVNVCLKHSPCVKLTYLPGNHAPANDHSLLYGMAVGRAFEDLEVNLSQDQLKHDWLGTHSIYSHHGDVYKNMNKVFEVITGKYPKEWGESTSRYYISGHLHNENAVSKSILQSYRMMSPSKSNGYEQKHGWDVTEKGIMLFEFDDDKRSVIYYL